MKRFWVLVVVVAVLAPVQCFADISADLNNDGVVDSADLLLFMKQWHMTTGAPGEPGTGQTATVSLPPKTTVAPDAEVAIPVQISAVSNLATGLLKVSYDPAVLQAVGVDRGAFIANEWLDLTNLTVPGQIVWAGFTLTTSAGAGDLVVLKFKAIGEAGASSVVSIEQTLEDGNGNTMQVAGTSGTVIVE